MLANFKLIERIGNLLRSEQRKQYAAIGLQPIHGQVLESLASCITVVAVNFFRAEVHHYLCGLTEEPSNRDDTDKICRDHHSQADSFTDRE